MSTSKILPVQALQTELNRRSETLKNIKSELNRIEGASQQKEVPFHSQIGQDKWVVEKTLGKRNGYFVEIGASDGVKLSNTFTLEKHYNWQGICVEPNPKVYQRLCQNRTCITVNDCIYSESGLTLEFLVCGVLSTLENFATNDHHAKKRNQARTGENLVSVRTTEPNELLEKHGAPTYIDYMSIDTEGSELEIVKSIDFDKWKIALLTIEHNKLKDKREKIFNILSKKGYKRIRVKFDDWYYHEGHLTEILLATATSLMEKGRYIDALQNFEKILECYPKYTSLYLRIGAIYAQKGLRKNTKSYFKRAIQNNLSQNQTIPLNSCLYLAKGVVHVGGQRQGQEAPLYANFNLPVVWIEALPNIFETLKKNISKYKSQIAIQALIADFLGTSYQKVISKKNSLSDFIYGFRKFVSGSHSFFLNANLHYKDFTILKNKTLFQVYQENNLNASQFNFLVLDVRGTELLVLQGSEPILNNFDFIYIVFNTSKVHQEGCFWNELKHWLNQRNFYEMSSRSPQNHDSVLFVRIYST